jgi:hypothetical protein
MRGWVTPFLALGGEKKEEKEEKSGKWAKGQVAVQEVLVQKYQLFANLLFTPVQKSRPFCLNRRRPCASERHTKKRPYPRKRLFCFLFLDFKK